MSVKVKYFIQTLMVFVLVLSCQKNEHPVEDIYVNIYIDLSDPQFFNLTAIGNPVYITGGVKGLIVMKTAEQDYVAFDRNCPYQAQKRNVVKITADQQYARCDSCQSKYLLINGSVVTGPSKYPLKSYQTSIQGNVLHIYN